MGVTSLFLSVWRPTPDAAAAAAADKAVEASRISQDSSIASLDPHEAADAAEDTDIAPSMPMPIPATETTVLPTITTTTTTSTAPAPRRCRRVTFALTKSLYRWLEAMAVRHNYGSVHKSVRDLLEWARTGDDADMEWLFASPHAHPAKKIGRAGAVVCDPLCIPSATDVVTGRPDKLAPLPLQTQRCVTNPPPTERGACAVPTQLQHQHQHQHVNLSEVEDDDDDVDDDDDDDDDDETDEDGPVPPDAGVIARRCKAAAACATPGGPVVLDAFVSDAAAAWVTRSARRFGLHGAGAVLDAVMRAVVELGAADDVFESDECGRDLPASTAELYCDLGIFGAAPVRIPVSAASPR